MEGLLLQVDRNLDDKQHSLATDVMCLDMRATLKTGDRTRLPNETDRNIVLTRMEKEIPLESWINWNFYINLKRIFIRYIKYLFIVLFNISTAHTLLFMYAMFVYHF